MTTIIRPEPAARHAADRPRLFVVAVRIAGALGLAAIAALIAFQIAPATIGGPNNYMLTHGTSMLPTIKPSSLVVTHRESSYRVGQVVAYNNPDLHTVVLHRIIGRDGDKYIFKGDNNPFPDFYEPTQADLIGARVLYLPSAGRVLLSLRNPIVGAFVLGALTVWALWDTDKTPPKRRRGRRSQARSAPDIHATPQSDQP